MIINSSSNLKYFVSIGVLATLSIATWLLTRSVFAQTYAPVPVLVKYAEKKSDYKGERSSESTLAVRADGSQVEAKVIRSYDGETYTRRTIMDLIEGKKTVIDPITESKTTYVLSDLAVLSKRMPASGCTNFTPDGSLHGYAVVRLSTPTPVPHGSQRVDAWYAPKLGCVLLKQQFVKTREDGSSVGTVVKEAVQITIGEPPAELFAIPNYQERPPSAVLEEARRKYSLPPVNPKMTAEIDKVYSLRQSK